VATTYPTQTLADKPALSAIETAPMLSHIEVRGFLKQRFPLLMIDTVISIEPGVRVVALKNVSGNEWQFLGHFPDHPLMPGALLIESLAQTASFLGWSPSADGRAPSMQYLANANVTFHKPIYPGDQIVNEVKQTRQLADMRIVAVASRVAGAMVARGELILASRGGS